MSTIVLNDSLLAPMPVEMALPVFGHLIITVPTAPSPRSVNGVNIAHTCLSAQVVDSTATNSPRV